MARRQVSVVALRARLADVLREVEKGHQVLVTRAGRPVARVIPANDAEGRLRAIGWHPAKRPRRRVPTVRLSGTLLAKAIVADRE